MGYSQPRRKKRKSPKRRAHVTSNEPANPKETATSKKTTTSIDSSISNFATSSDISPRDDGGAEFEKRVDGTLVVRCVGEREGGGKCVSKWVRECAS